MHNVCLLVLGVVAGVGFGSVVADGNGVAVEGGNGGGTTEDHTEQSASSEVALGKASHKASSYTSNGGGAHGLSLQKHIQHRFRGGVSHSSNSEESL